ncbi:MAG TPA: hypothetical protein VKV16_05495 [Solirubrobacteraceae bacterium]|nr:hypothetical protein [Solirubrobacteraceae bacterium]
MSDAGVQSARGRPDSAPTGARASVAAAAEGARAARLPLGVPGVLLALALGTALIAVGFAGGRAHDSWAEVPFWAGWVMSVLVLAAAITGAGWTDRERVLMLALQAAQQSFVRWMYSPLAFTFPDELQHWRTAVSILEFHHLFHPNPSLPVSPAFPGLEEMATALVSLSRIGVFPAGLLLAATSHVVLSVAMFHLYRRVSGSASVAGLGAFLFALNPLHAGFDSMFIYQAPALLLGAVVLESTLGERTAGGRIASGHPQERTAFVVAVICMAALVITHHVTAAVVIAALGVLALLFAAFRSFGALAKRLLALCVVGAAMAVLWVSTEAQAVVSYLGKPLATAAGGVLHLGHQAGTVALPATAQGTPGAWLTVLGTAITAVLVAIGIVLVWRRISPHGGMTLPRAFATVALGYYGVLGIREFAPDGAELAGRLLTFAALFTSVTMAFALVPRPGSARRTRELVRVLAVAASVGIFLGSTMSGWPAPWELVPGTFHISGFESGIDRENTLAVKWFAAHEGGGHRVACEFEACSMFGAYAGAYPIPDEPSLYRETTMSKDVVSLIHRRRIQFVYVDLRMSREAPITGHYFRVGSSQSGGRERRIPLAGLTKFRRAAGVRLIYDSGPIQIYDVRSLPYG